MLGVYGAETLFFIVEIQLDRASWPVTVFFDKYVCQFLAVGLGIVIFLAVNESDDVGILLDGARFAQVS